MYLRMKLNALWFVVSCVALAGCGGETTDTVTVQILDWDQTQKLVAGKKGRVVVVDVWATTCAPCLKEFPNLVALHEKHGRAKVACVSVSCDYMGLEAEPPESYKEKVLSFLKKKEAKFDNVLLNVPSDEFFEKANLASIPAVYVYDRDGKLRKRFDNETGEYGEAGFSYEKHINPLVEELLAAKS